MLDSYRIKKVLEHPSSKISRNFISEYSPIEIMEFLSKLRELFTSEIYKDIKEKNAILILVKKDKLEGFQENLFEDFVNLYKESQYNKFIIDFDGNIKEKEQEDQTNITDDNLMYEVSEEHENELFITIDVYQIDIFYQSKRLNIFNNINDIFRMGRSKNKNALCISDYRRLIKNHFESEVLDEKAINYWHQKSTRLLINKPEKFFHKNLVSYLMLNVIDGKVLSEVSNNRTPDSLDIFVEEYDSNKSYIFEVKWIGESFSIGDSNTVYKIKDMCAAFKQLNIYLNNDPNSKQGVLVVYDASKEDEKISCNFNNIADLSQKLDQNAIKLYLNSESASKKAKKQTKL